MKYHSHILWLVRNTVILEEDKETQVVIISASQMFQRLQNSYKKFKIKNDPIWWRVHQK